MPNLQNEEVSFKSGKKLQISFTFTTLAQTLNSDQQSAYRFKGLSPFCAQHLSLMADFKE